MNTGPIPLTVRSLCCVALLGSCAGQVSQDEVPAAVPSERELAAVAPGLLNVVHEDISWKLSEYTAGGGEWRKTPGMVAAVVKGEHITAIGAAGMARRDATAPGARKDPDGPGTPMTRDTVFNIGSNTKSMSALLLSMLIEEHPALSWSTTLAEALPWAEGYIRPVERESVTLEQIVGHRAGFDCNNTRFSHPDYPAGWKDKTHEQLLREYLRGPEIVSWIQPPGDPTGYLADCLGTIGVYEYENLDFTIVGAVIEHWSGKHFLQYAKEKLVDRYGMGATFLPSQAWFLAQSGSITGTAQQKAYWNPYFFQPTHPYLAAGKVAWGHHSDDEKTEAYEAFEPVAPNDPDVDPWGISPSSGGFAFNVYDWARYAVAQLRDRSKAMLDTHRLSSDLGPVPPPGETYNYGWKRETINSKWGGTGITSTKLCHTGSISGALSAICVYPELDLAYLAFANGGEDAGGANRAVLDWMRVWRESKTSDTGGCLNHSSVKGVQRFWNGNMFGCAGKVAFPERASLCATGYHVCSASEFVANNSFNGQHVEAPKYHYWVADQLGYGGTSGSCWAAKLGTSCGQDNSMRICAPPVGGGTVSFDQVGNKCNWTGCDLLGSGGDSDDYLGGCLGNLTAGTLCCADE